jgi:hypothetical protein
MYRRPSRPTPPTTGVDIDSPEPTEPPATTRRQCLVPNRAPPHPTEWIWYQLRAQPPRLRRPCHSGHCDRSHLPGWNEPRGESGLWCPPAQRLFGHGSNPITDRAVWLGTWSITIPEEQKSVEYARSGVQEVFRTRSLQPGIGIVATDGRTHYFWTLRPTKVLAAFRTAGYTVGPGRRPKGAVLGQFPLPRRRRRT